MHHYIFSPTSFSYIFAFIWSELKELWENGLEHYVGDMWNIVDYGTNWFYVNWILLR